MKTIQLSEQKAAELYKTASPEFKQLLEENFTKSQLVGKITDKIKSWLDVVEALGGRNKIYLPFDSVCFPQNKDDEVRYKNQISQNAFVKIQAISRVLNEGWVPDFNDVNEYKWYPYFEKQSAGWVFCGSFYHSWFGHLGSGFYFKTKELADYAGKQFIDIYREYLPK